MLQIHNKPKCNVLGMMSGTSGDGIDAALVEFSVNENLTLNSDATKCNDLCNVASKLLSSSKFENSINILDINARLLWHEHYQYSNSIQNLLLELMAHASSKEVMYGHSLVAQLYYDAFRYFKQIHSNDTIDIISAHGQTIEHDPTGVEKNSYTVKGTLQLLDGSFLAEKTQIPVVFDFRKRDIAVGGQGAPLVPFGDLIFFGKLCKNCILVLNIGGIANLTVIQKINNQPEVIQAFDVGPGNMLMDGLVHRISNGKLNYDIDGKIASGGKVIDDLLSELMKDEYIHQKPPKSTGRDKFGKKLEEELWNKYSSKYKYQDLLATYSAFTAECIKYSIEKFIIPSVSHIDEIIVAGGGAFNTTLMQNLEQKLRHICKLTTSNIYGVPIMAREAMAFAALGFAYIMRIPSNIPSATGATKKVCLGVLAL